MAKWKEEAPKFGQVEISLLVNGKMMFSMALVYFTTSKIKQRGKENGASVKDIAGSRHHNLLM